MTPALLVAGLVAVASALGSGALLWRARVARTSGALVAAAGGVGLVGIVLAQRAHMDAAEMAAVVAILVLLPAALWAYPRPRWRHPVDFALGVSVVAPGVAAVLRPTEEVLFLMSIVMTMALVAQGWWRLETEVPPWRGALVWSGLASAGVAVFAWVALFVGEEGPWLFPAVLVSLATIPISMVIGVVRPHVVDVRGLVVQVAVFVVLAMGYVAAFVGLLASGEVLGITDLPPAVPALVGFGLALALPPAQRRLRGVMDQILFGDRPDPLDAASNVVAGIGYDPRDALDSIRVGMALPYLALTRDGQVVLESGEPVAHHRDVALGGAGSVGTSLVVGLRPGDLRLAEGDARALALVAPLVIQLIRAEELTERLQASRREAVETIADERRRLRRDLHDGLGPTLTGIAFATDAARNTLLDDPQAAAELLATVRADTADAITQIRTLVYGMRPPALDEIGLVPALRQQARALLGRNGAAMPVEFDLEGELPTLPAAVEVAAYRIVVEALTNVARHTSAGSAAVRLGVDDGALVLEVRDDAAPGAVWTPGVGIASMRERALELGGTLSCGPTPGGGRVSAELPLGPPSSPR
ncbi:MAG TPA: sensor histidine kinase [Motilibacterales bacterium]|nr:sensor histidine kinase [Motilibacterales bacterium]